jgi:hypothetical protein
VTFAAESQTEVGQVPVKQRENSNISNCYNYNNNNNNQAFYSQASWGRLEMKQHKKKNRYKTIAKKKGKINGDKKPNQK